MLDCPPDAHCTHFPLPLSYGIINALIMHYVFGRQKVCTASKHLTYYRLYETHHPTAPPQQGNNLIQSPVKLTGLFLSQRVAESLTLNAHGMDACHC